MTYVGSTVFLVGVRGVGDLLLLRASPGVAANTTSWPEAQHTRPDHIGEAGDARRGSRAYCRLTCVSDPSGGGQANPIGPQWKLDLKIRVGWSVGVSSRT